MQVVSPSESIARSTERFAIEQSADKRLFWLIHSSGLLLKADKSKIHIQSPCCRSDIRIEYFTLRKLPPLQTSSLNECTACEKEVFCRKPFRADKSARRALTPNINKVHWDEKVITGWLEYYEVNVLDCILDGALLEIIVKDCWQQLVATELPVESSLREPGSCAFKHFDSPQDC
jgi:hypothetical protein